MDQEVMHQIKNYYRMQLVEKLLLSEAIDEEIKELDLNDAVFMLSKAWEKNSVKNIVHSWKKLLDFENIAITKESNQSIIADVAMGLNENLNKRYDEINTSVERLLKEEFFEQDFLSNDEIVTTITNSRTTDLLFGITEPFLFQRSVFDNSHDPVELKSTIEGFDNVIHFADNNEAFSMCEKILLKRIIDKLMASSS